ncbi:MAG: glycosyltransferase family 39 protein [Anaerolineae bacterium]
MRIHQFWTNLALKRREWISLLLILIIGALLRLYALSAESFYFDEVYSVWAARHSIGWLFSLSTQRIFPPLYYMLLHFWLVFGESEFSVRLLSVTLGLISIVGVYTLAKQLFDAQVGLLSALLLTISPLHLWYSQEARMYILVLTLGLYSAYFMLLALQKGQYWHWLAYVLSTAMAMNTHYFILFLAAFENVYVLYAILRRRVHSGFWRPWLLSQVAIGLLSAVGLAGIFSAESGYWWGLLDVWHGAPTWRDLVGTLFKFSFGAQVSSRVFYWVGLPLFGFAAAWSLIDFRRKRMVLSVDDGWVFCFLYLALPIGTVFVISQFRSFWILRYIFPFLPPYCIIVARGISRMPGRIWPALMAITIVWASLWPIANIYRYEQKESWRAVVQYIASQEGPGDFIFMVDEDVWLPFEHYYRGSLLYVGVSRTITDRDFLAARVGLVLPTHHRIWLVLSHTNNFALKDYLVTSRYTKLVSEKHFTSIEVDLFAINP